MYIAELNKALLPSLPPPVSVPSLVGSQVSQVSQVTSGGQRASGHTGLESGYELAW